MTVVRLAWADEFDGPAGAAPSSWWWTAELGRGGEREVQTYTAPPPYATLTRDDVPAGGWRSDRDFYLLLNLAIGGAWPGNDVDDPPLPATMLVDWVRVYAHRRRRMPRQDPV
jgi:hypothetical protein